MYETNEMVVIKTGLPGTKPEDVDLSAVGQRLTIRGAIEREEDLEVGAYLLRERRYGSFSRTLDLPEGAVVDEAKAELKDGVLTITIPKAEEVQATTIKVKGTGGN